VVQVDSQAWGGNGGKVKESGLVEMLRPGRGLKSYLAHL